MPYVDYNFLSDLKWTSSLFAGQSELAAAREREVEVQEKYSTFTDAGSLPFEIKSTADKSLFNTSRWNPDQLIEVITGINIPGTATPLKISIPIRELLIAGKKIKRLSFSAIESQMAEYKRQLQQQSPRQISGDETVTATMINFVTKWGAHSGGIIGSTNLDYEVISGKRPSEESARAAAGYPRTDRPFTYYGFSLIEPNSNFNYTSIPIQGSVRISLPDGTVLGTIPYYYIKPNIPIPRSSSARLVGFDAGAPSISGSDISRWRQSYDKAYKLTRMDGYGLGDLGAVFADLCRGYRAGDVGGNRNMSWEYMPDLVQKEVEDYYNVKDPQELINQGYSEADAIADIYSRAQLRGEFPYTSATAEFARWANKRSTGTAAVWSPADVSTINALIARNPIEGMLAFKASDVAAVRQAFINASGETVEKSQEIFRNTMFALTAGIENIEIMPFNWIYYCYVAKGMIPQTMINTAVNAYNKRKEDAARDRAQQGILTTALTLGISAIPVVGVGFGLALGAAGAYSNYQAVKLEAERQEEKAEAVQREVAVTSEAVTEYQEQAQVVQEVNREEKADKTKKAMLAIGAVGAGIVTAAATLMD